MTYKVKFTHSDKSHAHINCAELREGVEIYQHPEGYFVVLEFEGKSGREVQGEFLAGASCSGKRSKWVDKKQACCKDYADKE